ncbi:DUF4350 domain-containing protein [Tenacibaculum xiamenense]|uniref:DUF4350 domain-containing protein n=1 Tax=Tenacibaculum xiamenense TaxID=1261553 RepID=UPI003894BD60
MNNFKKIAFLFVLTLVFVGCKKTNWNENYREYSKDPFGTYILREEASELFNNNEVIYLKKNIYDYFYSIYYQNEENFANYITIKHNAVKLDKESITKLLEFVEDGNEAFLSLNFFPIGLKDSLNFETENLDNNAYGVKELKKLKGKLFLYPNDDRFTSEEYTFDRNIRRHHFSEFDAQNTIVLGSQYIDGKKLPNFIKIKHGKGAVYLHSQPIAFTNYYLLKEQKAYTEHALSFLSDNTILWDPLVKRRKNTKEKEDNSVFKFFWQHESLKWSLYVALFGLLLFIVFNARRKQRAIPIIEKLKNSTVDFTHTIANLYLKEDNHKNLVDKKITYFLELVRTKYLLNTQKLNGDFIEKLASKSGNKLSTTRYLINTIVALDKKSTCTQDELMRLNTLIENFFETH